VAVVHAFACARIVVYLLLRRRRRLLLLLLHLMCRWCCSRRGLLPLPLPPL
jgi:hypothetical protein